MPFDYKKDYREFYLPKAVPQLVSLPPIVGFLLSAYRIL